MQLEEQVNQTTEIIEPIKVKKEKHPGYSMIDIDFTMDEKEKIFLEKTGSEFNVFYKKYLPKLIYFVNNFCHDKQMAEDLAIDSFMISLNKINDFDPDCAKFSTWIFTIARNLTYHNLNKRNKFVSIDTPMESDDDGQGTTLKDFLSNIDDEEHNEDYFESIDKKAEIMKKSMSKLNKNQRRVIKMREIDKMPYQSIADKEKKNLNTIKSQIRNARLELIEITKDEFKRIDSTFL